MIVIDNDRRSKNKNGRYTLNSYRIFSLQFTPELMKIRRTEEKLWLSWLRWRDIT